MADPEDVVRAVRAVADQVGAAAVGDVAGAVAAVVAPVP